MSGATKLLGNAKVAPLNGADTPTLHTEPRVAALHKLPNFHTELYTGQNACRGQGLRNVSVIVVAGSPTMRGPSIILSMSAPPDDQPDGPVRDNAARLTPSEALDLVAQIIRLVGVSSEEHARVNK